MTTELTEASLEAALIDSREAQPPGYNHMEALKQALRDMQQRQIKLWRRKLVLTAKTPKRKKIYFRRLKGRK